jgi:hypothetical protein
MIRNPKLSGAKAAAPQAPLPHSKIVATNH